MFDKLIFNNQLVTNKKKVQKAKTICINKLVQKIRKLKSLQEKSRDDKKFAIKIDRITERIECLQKMKNMEALRNAILYDKNPNSVLTNGLALPEEVAEALLFSQKIIVDIVRNIKEVCELNSKNSGWKAKILELSKKQLKLKHIKHVQEKIETRKAQKELKRKRNQWLEENLQEENKKLTEENQTEWKELPLEPIDLSKEIICSETKLKSINKPTKPFKIKKNDQIKDQLNESDSNIANNIPIGQNNENEEENLETVKTVDSFFLTDTGNNYLSTVYIDRVQPDGPDDGMVRKERRKIQKRNPTSNQPHKTKGNFKMHSIENGKIIKNNAKAVSSNNKRNSKPEVSENPLHPSWAAKQKQKTFQQFSGKKILFDEDDNHNKRYSKPEVSENPLHPSWAAKQKQKTFQEFSGKKILFDETENHSKPSVDIRSLEKVNESKSNEKLHPSWEAKQKLKPAIHEFKGKKTTFDLNE